MTQPWTENNTKNHNDGHDRSVDKNVEFRQVGNVKCRTNKCNQVCSPNKRLEKGDLK